MALSNESDDLTAGFAEGVEFEETFPESNAPAAPEPAPAPVAPPRLKVLPDEPAPASGDLLDRRLREAETRIVARIELVIEESQRRFERRLRDLERSIDERPARRERGAPELQAHADVRRAIAAAASAREVGRILRDALAGRMTTSVFAIALHLDRGEEVAYRYRVASEDKLGDALRTETLDDGPLSPAAYMDGWVRGQRAVRAGGRNFTVHTAQSAIRDGRPTIGVLTLQSEQPLGDVDLDEIAELIAIAAPRLGELRDAGRFAGPRRP